MHSYLVNASIQILPIAQDRHPYQWVDEAILVIQKSGVKYEVGPFTTIVEGTYAEVMEIVGAVNEHLFSMKCTEWITSVQINIRSEGDVTADEKVSKFGL
jgi:uncharacterized protein (TIGR00106 family)